MPKPKFIMPLAVPAYCGAMSIGTAQIGATTSSEKKKASDRHRATVVRSWVRTTGTRNTKAPTIPTMIRLRRAAWSGSGRIRKVEVSADGGASWAEAALDTPALPQTLTGFRMPWRWSGGPATLMSRATDETGAVQPMRTAWIGKYSAGQGYHSNAVQNWGVDPHGRIAHVYA